MCLFFLVITPFVVICYREQQKEHPFWGAPHFETPVSDRSDHPGVLLLAGIPVAGVREHGRYPCLS